MSHGRGTSKTFGLEKIPPCKFAEELGCVYLPLFWQRLGDRCAQLGADAGERGVDACGESTHAGGSTEGDESDDQGVLNQVLTLFVAFQVLEFHIEFKQQVTHCSPHRMFCFPSLSLGTIVIASRVPFSNI